MVNIPWSRVFLNGIGGSKKGREDVLADQDHACVYLRSQGDSSLWIHCTRTNGESIVLLGSADKVTGIRPEENTLWQCPCAWCVKSSRVHGYEISYKNEPSTLSPDLATCDVFIMCCSTACAAMFACDEWYLCTSTSTSTQIPQIPLIQYCMCCDVCVRWVAHSDKNGAINYKIHPTQI
jgi:hypothetical protein